MVSRLVSGHRRFRYRRIARRAVRDLEDYVASGFEVVGVVGVAGSPSCGVDTTLDLGRALKTLGSTAPIRPASRSNQPIRGREIGGTGEGRVNRSSQRRHRSTLNPCALQ